MKHKTDATYWATLGGRVRAARNKRNMTQRGLAKLVGRSHGAIHQWETNVTSPTGRTLQKLLVVFPELEIRDKVPAIHQQETSTLSADGGKSRFAPETLRKLADLEEKQRDIDEERAALLRDLSRGGVD